MKVGIIGTGNVGGALAKSLSAAGHTVTIAARDAQKAQSVATATGSSAASVTQAAAGAEVVVLAVPYASVVEVARAVAAAAPGAVLVDATNPAKPDYSGLSNIGDLSAAEQVAAAVPGTRVVKAFNTLFASVSADPTALGVELDGLYATDDDTAAATVAALLASIGLRPVRVGGLIAARELEALAWLNIRLQLQAGGDWRSSFTIVGAPAAAVGTPPVPVGAAA
jgi:predicted dinucleotide-binding enzyme